MSDTDNDFIDEAIKHPGALRATAESEGAMTESGKIRRSWLEDKAKGDDITARRARLALAINPGKKRSE